MSNTLLNPLDSIGQRLRQARRQLGLSQETVAGGAFTKSYISAIERNKVRPSLKALHYLATQLNVPMHELVSEVDRAEADEIETSEDALDDQLDNADWLIEHSQPGEALMAINSAEEKYGDAFQRLDVRTRYRFFLLRACAQLRLRAMPAAREDLVRAMALAKELAEGTEQAERVRYLLGLTYYREGKYHRALEYHIEGLDAIRQGSVGSLNLQLAIYAGVADDYMALGNTQEIRVIYEEAVSLAHGATALKQQAYGFWNRGIAQGAEGNPAQARRDKIRALGIHEAQRNLTSAAQMRISLAGIAIEEERYEAADRLLNESAQSLPYDGNGLTWSYAYERHAAMELKRNKIDLAEEYARLSRELAAAVYQDRSLGDEEEQSRILRSYARALRTAALITEVRGYRAEADEWLAQALGLLEGTQLLETRSEIEFDYAELLRARGDHEAAGEHYRRAFEFRQRLR